MKELVEGWVEKGEAEEKGEEEIFQLIVMLPEIKNTMFGISNQQTKLKKEGNTCVNEKRIK